MYVTAITAMKCQVKLLPSMVGDIKSNTSISLVYTIPKHVNIGTMYVYQTATQYTNINNSNTHAIQTSRCYNRQRYTHTTNKHEWNHQQKRGIKPTCHHQSTRIEIQIYGAKHIVLPLRDDRVRKLVGELLTYIKYIIILTDILYPTTSTHTIYNYRWSKFTPTNTLQLPTIYILSRYDAILTSQR